MFEGLYNGYSIIVNVCLFVELFLDLGVLSRRPARDVGQQNVVRKRQSWPGKAGKHLLDTTGVQGSLVDAVGHHVEGAERSRVVVGISSSNLAT